VSELDVLLVAAVLVGVAIQAAIGFGFALFVAPAAFAALPPGPAVTLLLLLAIAINLLVLFTERRARAVAERTVATILLASIPGVVAGVWLLERADRELIQLLVGTIVLATAIAQGIAMRPRPAREPAAPQRRRALELGGGVAAGALTTSVGINGPVLVLVFTRLGFAGDRMRDSLAAALLGLALLALPVLLVGAEDAAVPQGWIGPACIPALWIGHRFGAAAFRRLDDRAHRRVILVAAALAGALSIAAAIVG